MSDANNPRNRRGPEGTLKMPSEPPPPPSRGGPRATAPLDGSSPKAPAPLDGSGRVQMPDSWDARHSGQSARVELPPVQPSGAPEPEDGPSKAMIVLGILTVIAVTAAAGFVAWELTNPTGAPAPAPVPAPAGSAAPASPSASTSAAPSASAAALSSGGCFAELLPAGALGTGSPDLGACCREQPAYPTMLKLKSAVVSAGQGKTTAAMREWSKLGWYELAAFALMRAQCCPDAPPLTTPQETQECPLEPALAGLAKALDDGPALEKALREYRAAVDCLVDKGHADLFGRNGPPQGGELQYIEQLLARLRRARGR